LCMYGVYFSCLAEQSVLCLFFCLYSWVFICLFCLFYLFCFLFDEMFVFVLWIFLCFYIACNIVCVYFWFCLGSVHLFSWWMNKQMFISACIYVLFVWRSN